MSDFFIFLLVESFINNLSYTYYMTKKGCELTEEHKKNLKLSHSKEKHYNWQDGKSFEPYGIEFNNQLKEFIRKRDNFRCQQCFRNQDELFTKKGRRYKLMIHHIDFNKRNNNPNNLISLCRNCHIQTNYNRKDWIDYFKDKLMEMV